jgi:phosphatidate cytidylyltransferase
MKHSLPSAGVSIAVCCYLGFALISLAYIFYIPDTLASGTDAGRWLIVFCILMVWSGDSAAYLVGSSMGRRRIAPVVSPGKTYEGTFANLVGNFVFAYIASKTFLTELQFHDVLILSLIFWFFGFYGDLIESSWKRGSGIKDSSHLFPGHGGIMDRVDSMFLTLPLFYFYMTRFVLE